MQIANQFVEGTVAFQNFNNDVKANSHLTIEQLNMVHEKLIVKADNFLNYSINQRDSLHKKARAIKALIDFKTSALKQNMKYLVIFELDGFYGEINLIPDISKLYKKVFDRCYLTGQLDDESGNVRSKSDFSEEQLMKILRSVCRASHIHLVDSIESIKAISDDETYHRRLVDEFCANQ